MDANNIVTNVFKHAYFALNETVRYYQARGTSVHVASLDAEKAFDSLWRNGLFHKLIGRIPDFTWRAMVTYYNQSLVRVRYNDQQTSTFAISGGVKQGGILSPFLFNFFIDDLLKGCTDLRLGCKLGRSNVSILAYCDDIVLVSASLGQLRQLLLFCEEYSSRWRMKFNAGKSTHSLMACSKTEAGEKHSLSLHGKPLAYTDGFVYLGLPIGNDSYVREFIDSKFNKCTRTFYSQSCFGCHVDGLAPRVTAFMYRTFCQPILAYCLEGAFVGERLLKVLNSRQATLVKTFMGVSKFAKTTPLLHALRISSITHLYHKMKLIFLKQLQCNALTNDILGFLRSKYSEKYSDMEPPKHSAIYQLNRISSLIGTDVFLLDFNQRVLLLNNQFVHNDEMVRNVSYVH